MNQAEFICQELVQEMKMDLVKYNKLVEEIIKHDKNNKLINHYLREDSLSNEYEEVIENQIWSFCKIRGSID